MHRYIYIPNYRRIPVSALGRCTRVPVHRHHVILLASLGDLVDSLIIEHAAIAAKARVMGKIPRRL